MQAVVVEDFGRPDGAVVRAVPVPQPGPRQVRIRVVAAGVNPVDLVTRAGVLAQAGLHPWEPVGLGWDVAGVVDEVGGGVRRLRAGQAVIGLSDRLAQPSKAHAELVLLDEEAVAAVPSDADLFRLATLPLAGLTALQALDRVDLREGQSLLVTGAAGSVGSLAVQLARLFGVRVVGAGRAHQRGDIEAAGAAFVEARCLASAVREIVPGGVDAAIDCANLGLPSLDAVRRGGHHVSLVVLDRPAPLRGTTSTSLAVRADWRQLAFLAQLAATDTLRLRTPRRMPLSRAVDAYATAESDRSRPVVLEP